MSFRGTVGGWACFLGSQHPHDIQPYSPLLIHILAPFRIGDDDAAHTHTHTFTSCFNPPYLMWKISAGVLADEELDSKVGSIRAVRHLGMVPLSLEAIVVGMVVVVVVG